MNTALKFSSILDLPRLLVDYLLSNPLVAFNSGLLVNYGFDADKRETIVRMQGELVFRTLQVEDLPTAIRERLGVADDQKIHNMAQDIFNEFCGPIRWYFPQLRERLEKMGFVLNATDLFPILQPKTSLAEAIAAVMTKMGDLPRSIKDRVASLVELTLRAQVYDEGGLRAQLSKSMSDGGFGLGETNVRTFISQIKEYVTLYAFSDIPDVNSDAAAPVFSEVKLTSSPPPSTIDPATIPRDMLAAHEASEVDDAAAAAQTVASSTPSSQHQSLVEAVLAVDALHDRSEEIQKRWRTIVEMRVGGARDATKTRAMLETPEANGGLGLSAAEATRLATMLEQTAGGFEKRGEEFSVMEKIASVQQAAAGIMAGPEATARETQKKLNERFISMFGKGAVEEMRRETHRELQTAEAAHPGEEARSHMAPIAMATAAATVQPAAKTELPPPPPSAAPLQEPKYIPRVPEKLKQLIDTESSAYSLSSLKQKSGPPSAPPQKKTSDIRPSTRLVGPMDELQTMSLVDFRRLSPDVSVRIQKIRSKIEVIGQDGPHEKIRAIAAFEQSDPVRVYRGLLKRSLIEGRTIDELSGELKKSGGEYLDADEIAALRQFLSQIRYSSL